MAMQKFIYQNQVVIVYKGIPYFDGSGYVEIFEPMSGNTKMVQISELTPIPNVTIVVNQKEKTKTAPKKESKKETPKKKVEKKKLKKESIENKLEIFLNEEFGPKPKWLQDKMRKFAEERENKLKDIPKYPDEKRGLSRFAEYKKLHPYKQSQELKDNPTLNNATKIAKNLVDKDKKKIIKGVQADHLKFRKDNVYKESVEEKPKFKVGEKIKGLGIVKEIFYKNNLRVYRIEKSPGISLYIPEKDIINKISSPVMSFWNKFNKNESIEYKLQSFLDEKKKTKNFLKDIKKGGFHEWLGKSEDDEITASDIKKGLASDDPHVVKMANFAKNAKKWKHKGRVAESLDEGVMSICPKCGGELGGKTANGKLVCSDCGFKVIPKNESISNKIQSYLEENKDICPDCGKKLINGKCPHKAEGKCKCHEKDGI